MRVGVEVVGAVVGYRLQVVRVTVHLVKICRDRLYSPNVNVPLVIPYFGQESAKDGQIINDISIVVPRGVGSHSLRLVSIQDVMGTAADEVEEPGNAGMAGACEVEAPGNAGWQMLAR